MKYTYIILSEVMMGNILMDVDAVAEIILKWILSRQNVRAWTGIIYFRTGFRDRFI
jgi:hypothetical protein